MRISVKYRERRIIASELARTLGDVLGRVRFRQDVFVVERHGEPVATLAPLPGATHGASLKDALAAWTEEPPADPRFADDLDRVNAADRPPTNPWA